MFGYHNSGFCGYDLWSPDERTKVNNLAFSAYAKHMQDLEDMAQEIASEIATSGTTSFTFSTNGECFAEVDKEYVSNRVNELLNG